MNMSSVWRTSVNHLLNAFRGSLIALIPTMETVRIPWRDRDAYDDWEQICETLFDAIVRNSTREQVDAGQPLPTYGIRRRDYADCSFIGPDSDNGEYAVFVKFKTHLVPFDMADIALLDEDLVVTGHESRAITDTRFALYVNSGGLMTKTCDISVEL